MNGCKSLWMKASAKSPYWRDDTTVVLTCSNRSMLIDSREDPVLLLLLLCHRAQRVDRCCLYRPSGTFWWSRALSWTYNSHSLVVHLTLHAKGATMKPNLIHFVYFPGWFTSEALVVSDLLPIYIQTSGFSVWVWVLVLGALPWGNPLKWALKDSHCSEMH